MARPTSSGRRTPREGATRIPSRDKDLDIPALITKAPLRSEPDPEDVVATPEPASEGLAGIDTPAPLRALPQTG